MNHRLTTWRTALLLRLPLMAAGFWLECPSAGAMNIDTGLDAIGAAKMTPEAGNGLPQCGWLRLRGIDEAREMETRTALQKLRVEGFRTCVLLRWPAKDWKTTYLPLDLREVFEKGRKLGAKYGDLVDAWEADNEPDLGFVPEAAEHYTAYLKASWLGLKRGIEENKASLLGVKGSELGGSDTNNQEHLTLNAKAPLVIMGALGLPPGPWLERFAANDGFAYTDGFNYHYYGYAEEFTAVYRAHEYAVRELSDARYSLAGSASETQASGQTASSQVSGFRSQVSPTYVQKNLPVFLTEVGYGMLGKQARDTKEGRLRQWRWFKSVGEQAGALRIEAPMAFYLQPYLEYDTLEFGLTVPRPAAQSTEDRGQRTEHKTEVWTAGGVDYTPDDFGAKRSEPWMELIGKEIGGNEVTPALAWWLAAPRGAVLGVKSYGLGGSDTKNKEFLTSNSSGSRSWAVTVPAISPIVIDFIAGEGLQPLKRYNGSFVTGNVPLGLKPEEAKPVLPPVIRPPKPPTPPRSEEFMIHVRAANGNLYEVYPTRMATPDWQNYLESQGNFTMSFYGRAELPWRFRDNKPVSLVVVMYPKQLPATYEFKRVQLIRLGEAGHEKAQKDTKMPAVNRYGQGKVVLYNFSDKPVSGELNWPDEITTEHTEDTGKITLAPNERREMTVVIKVGATRFERSKAAITFVPQDDKIPPARFVTEFFPALEGMQTTVVAALLQQKPETGDLRPEKLTTDHTENTDKKPTNSEIIANRHLATEEAPSVSSSGLLASVSQGENRGQAPGGQQSTTVKSQVSGFQSFAQQGAKVEKTSEGFTVTVTETPPGKEQRVEVEIPWPDGLEFKPEEFLSLEFRLRPEP